jgi:uncharacterized protein
MSVPQQLSYVTIGARSMTALRAFYGALGWIERPGSDDEYTTYAMDSGLLGIYPIAQLTLEAAPGEPLPEAPWKGVTFGIILPGRADVDEAFEGFLSAGATTVERPVQRPWGGYSGYVADPEGNRWEMAWTPSA